MSGPAEPGTAPRTPALRAPPAPGAGGLRRGAPEDAGGADARGYSGGGCAAEVEVEGEGEGEGEADEVVGGTGGGEMGDDALGAAVGRAADGDKTGCATAGSPCLAEGDASGLEPLAASAASVCGGRGEAASSSDSDATWSRVASRAASGLLAGGGCCCCWSASAMASGLARGGGDDEADLDERSDDAAEVEGCDEGGGDE